MPRPPTGLLAVALLASGCVGIPDEGPVVEAEADARRGEELGFFNDPPGPTTGEPPTDIVKHFLDAQAAIPLQTNTAEGVPDLRGVGDLAAAATDHHLRRRVVPRGQQPGHGRGRRRLRARRPRLLARGAARGRVRALVHDDPGRRRVADLRRARRAGRPVDVVRPGLPSRLALLHGPDRPDPGPGAGVRAAGRLARQRPGRRAARRPRGRRARGGALLPPARARGRPVRHRHRRRHRRGPPPGR